MTKKYHQIMNEEELGADVIAIVKNLCEERKFWTGSKRKRLQAAKKATADLCECLGISDVPDVIFRDYEEGEMLYMCTGGGSYMVDYNTIELYKKFSLVTFLHEFRHVMQHKLDIDMYKTNEDDARAWSLSLYYLADPVRFNRAARMGMLHYV